MLKKNLIILFIIFFILCISNVCFANNTANNIKDGVSSATTTVVDGAKNLATDVRNGVGSVENGIEGALSMNTQTANITGTANNNYTTARTAVTTSATGMGTSTMWIWAIVAIAAIIIIGLVWYYGSQNRVD